MRNNSSRTPKKLKKIFWIVNGIVKEEILKDNPVPEAVARWKKEQLKKSSHRAGDLKIVDDDAKPQDYNDKQLKLPLT